MTGRYTARLASALILTTLAWPGATASARTVAYLHDMALIKAAAADQGIEGPFAEPGSVQPGPVTLEAAGTADHRVTVVSVYCQAYGIDNPVSLLLADLLGPPPAGTGSAAPAGTDGATVMKMVAGSTVLRCVGKSDVEVLCMNRVRLTAEVRVPATNGSTTTHTLVAQVERKGRVGGFCGNIARYTGIVTREAAFDLLRQVEGLRSGKS